MNKEMILQHLSFAREAALNVYVKLVNVELDELESYAYLGLIDAVKRFDESRGVPFKAYASIRIRGAIMDELRRADWIPRYQRLQGKELKKIISLELVYERTDETNIEENYITKETAEWVLRQFKIVLTEKEQKAMHLRFFKDLALREIGGELGVSESRASQLIISSLNKLRQRAGLVS